MALKKCKECGQQVSSKADTCPNCGVSNPTSSCLQNIGVLLLVVFVVWLMAGGLFGDGDSTQSNADGFSTLSLNVREAPSTNHDIITALQKGEKVKFLDDSVGWKRVELIEREDYTTGWASGKYLNDIEQYDSWSTKQENQEPQQAQSQEQESQKQKYQVDKTGACVMIREFVKDRLKSPSSAEFPWCSDISVKYLGSQIYRVDGYVDAQNSFGAQIRTYYKGQIVDEGNSWTLMALEIQD